MPRARARPLSVVGRGGDRLRARLIGRGPVAGSPPAPIPQARPLPRAPPAPPRACAPIGVSNSAPPPPHTCAPVSAATPIPDSPGRAAPTARVRLNVLARTRTHTLCEAAGARSSSAIPVTADTKTVSSDRVKLARDAAAGRTWTPPRLKVAIPTLPRSTLSAPSFTTLTPKTPVLRPTVPDQPAPFLLSSRSTPHLFPSSGLSGLRMLTPLPPL